MLVETCYYLLGTMTGVSFCVGYGVWRRYKKFSKKATKVVEELKQHNDVLDKKRQIIQAYSKQVSEIVERQMALKAQLDMPSKNALHSHYKNGVIGEIKQLESQKLVLLRAILAEGVDPSITTIDEYGRQQEIPLSQFIKKQEGFVEETKAPVIPIPLQPKQEPPKVVRRFTLHQGGKIDADNKGSVR